MIGQTLRHYRIVAKLGAGGMGVVYRAEDTTLGRPVALKLLSHRSTTHIGSHERFLREARIVAALNHPAICTIYEVGEVPAGDDRLIGEDDTPIPAGAPYIAMELIDGETLAARLARRGGLPIEALVDAAVQVAMGLAEAHAAKVVHRDLKPQNVMFGPGDRVKILDFGVAKPLAPPDPNDAVLTSAETVSGELTRQGKIVGTAAYMSPEQAMGRAVDSRSDVFSFGIMLYEMATGVRPFRGDSGLSTLAKIIEATAPPLRAAQPAAPFNLDRIVTRCLQKDPTARYNDTRDLVVDLKDLQQEVASDSARATSGTVTPSGPTPAQGWQLPGRRAATLAIAVVGIVALVVVAWNGLVSPPAVPAVTPTHQQVTFVGVNGHVKVHKSGRMSSRRLGL